MEEVICYQNYYDYNSSYLHIKLQQRLQKSRPSSSLRSRHINLSEMRIISQSVN